MLHETAEFVIQGMTVDGNVFQPADWAERLCNSLAATSGNSIGVTIVAGRNLKSRINILPK